MTATTQKVPKIRAKVPKAGPMPVRLNLDDAKFLRQASFDTDLPMSELLRRSVRLLRRQKTMFKGYAFILELA